MSNKMTVNTLNIKQKTRPLLLGADSDAALFNSYTMGTSGLPDIYTRSLRAAGPRAEGVYIR